MAIATTITRQGNTDGYKSYEASLLLPLVGSLFSLTAQNVTPEAEGAQSLSGLPFRMHFMLDPAEQSLVSFHTFVVRFIMIIITALIFY